MDPYRHLRREGAAELVEVATRIARRANSGRLTMSELVEEEERLLYALNRLETEIVMYGRKGRNLPTPPSEAMTPLARTRLLRLHAHSAHRRAVTGSDGERVRAGRTAQEAILALAGFFGRVGESHKGRDRLFRLMLADIIGAVATWSEGDVTVHAARGVLGIFEAFAPDIFAKSSDREVAELARAAVIGWRDCKRGVSCWAPFCALCEAIGLGNRLDVDEIARDRRRVGKEQREYVDSLARVR